MTLRRWGLLFAGGLLVLFALGGGLLWSLAQPPKFYAEELAREIPPETRRQQAKTVASRTTRIVESVKKSAEWDAEFTQDQINSWLSEELDQKQLPQLPPHVHEPRVRLEDDHVQLAFQVQDPRTSARSVVSLLVKPSLRPSQKLELEIVSIQAGLVKLPIDRLLKEATDRLARQNWVIDWTKRDDRDVLTIDLTKWLPEDATMDELKVEAGKLLLRGGGTRAPEDEAP